MAVLSILLYPVLKWLKVTFGLDAYPLYLFPNYLLIIDILDAEFPFVAFGFITNDAPSFGLMLKDYFIGYDCTIYELSVNLFIQLFL